MTTCSTLDTSRRSTGTTPTLRRSHAYADAERYEFWKKRDPISWYARQLENDGILTGADVERLKREAEELVEAEAQAIIDAPWPEPETAARGVFAAESPRVRLEPLDPESRLAIDLDPPLPPVEKGIPYST